LQQFKGCVTIILVTKILILVAILVFIFFTGNSLAQSSPSVKYDLPYPGILPDHPLYKLKVLRDKIATFLISDPTKKAQYHLLLADKRLVMARMLVDKDMIELAKETALKGENEYTLLVFMYKDINKKPSKPLFNKLEKAAMKHQELLNEIVKKVSEKDKGTFRTVLGFSKRNLLELKSL